MASTRVGWILLVLASAAAADDVVALAAQLKTDRAHEAADRLADLGPGAKEAVPQLVAALQSEDNELRWRAAWALSRIGRDAAPAAAVLVPAALGDDRLLSTAARIALKHIGGAATDAVIAAMVQTPAAERPRYVVVLGSVEPKPQMVPLLIPFLEDANDEVRAEVYQVFASLGPRAADAAPALVGQLTKQPDVLPWDAIIAIGAPCVGPLLDLAKSVKDLRGEAIMLLACIPGPGVDAAKKCLDEFADGKTWDTFLNSAAMRSSFPPDLAPVVEQRLMKGEAPPSATRGLLTMGPAGEAALEKALFSASIANRGFLISRLRLETHPKVVPWLLRLADPAEPSEIRKQAVQVLITCKLDEDATRRAAALVDGVFGEDVALGCGLVAKLGSAGAPFAGRLRSLAEDAERPLLARAAAASALCRIGRGSDADVALLAKAVEASKDRRTDYWEALRLLASAGPAAAADFELLVPLVTGEDRVAGQIAAEGLGRMYPALGSNQGRILDAALQNPRWFAFWNVVTDTDDVACLAKLLSVEHAGDWAAGRLATLRAREPLMAALDAPDEETQYRAAEALVLLDCEKAVDQAWSITLSGWVRFGFEDFCLEHPQVAQSLVRTLASNEPSARGNAAYLLGVLAYRGAAEQLRTLVRHDADNEVRVAALIALEAALAGQ